MTPLTSARAHHLYTEAMRLLRLAVPAVAFALAVAVLAPSPARACGGGLVSGGTVAVASAQRIFLSLGKERTEVVTQVVVPESSADYGVLIPLPARPEIDPQPVSTAALDALDVATRPALLDPAREDGGCDCPFHGSDKAGAPPPRGGLMVSDPVEIGPVTAVALTADTGDAVSGWLADSGFALPANGRALIDRYAGAGRWFVALRRSQQATGPQPSSVGVHFSVPGDARALPLRFAALGAAAEVAFTVFVVSAARASGPGIPFEGLTLDQLDRVLVTRVGYRAAVKKAIADRRGQALVYERVTPIDGSTLPPELRALVTFGDEPTYLSRMTTVLDASALTQDVALDGPAPSYVPGYIVLAAAPSSGTPLFTAALLGTAALVRRRRRRTGT
jgi:hypothetical protein